MSVMNFLLETQKVWVYPATGLALTWMLKPSVSQLLVLLTKVKFKDLDVSFDRDVTALCTHYSEGRKPMVGLSADEQSLYRRLAEVSPRGVVLEVWIKLEQSARALLRRHGVKATTAELAQPKVMLALLERHGLLEKKQLALFDELRNLRNAAAHAGEFSLDAKAALSFADLSGQVRQAMAVLPVKKRVEKGSAMSVPA